MSDLIKDKECIHCRRLFNCTGKERGKLCVWFEERKKGEIPSGGKKDVHKENNG